MAINDHTLEMYQGNRRLLVFTVEDEETGNAKDLTGLSATFAMAHMNQQGIPARSNPVVDLSSTDPSAQVRITDAAGGVIEVELLCPDTLTLPAKDYHFQVEVHDSICGVMVATGTITLLTNIYNA